MYIYIYDLSVTNGDFPISESHVNFPKGKLPSKMLGSGRVGFQGLAEVMLIPEVKMG